MDGGLMDARTLAVLDFDAIRERVAREATTDRAAVRARAMQPRADLELVRSEQAATAEMRAIVADAPFDLPRTRDVEDAIERAMRGGTLGPEELRDVGWALAAADATVRRVRASTAATLKTRVAGARFVPEILAAIERSIGENGDVLDRASPALARIRRNAAHAQDEARDRLQAVLRSPKYGKAIQDALVTMRQGRFVVPVKAEFANALPGVVHDTSSSGHTLFVEPLDALDVNNRLRTLRLDEEHEVARILAELSSLVGSRAHDARTNLEALAEIDFVLARARVAEAMHAIAPAIVAGARVAIVRGRHPLIGERAVPQSLVLDEHTRMIVISGPNMGGKTVALKVVGLFVAMAYCGLALPADEGTTVGAFDFVGCDIGDEQSIVENASTFSAHLRRLRALLQAANERSLVLVDEIASGTEAASSAALAVAILERLLAVGAHAIVTTHSTELKLFAAGTEGVQNASVRFDAATYAPTYELDLGAPGQSLAFPLARALGLDPAIVARAEGLLSTSERDYDRALSELVAVRAEAAAERDALRTERAGIATHESAARDRADSLERERRALARAADERLTRALREFAAELERRSGERPGRGKVTSGQAALLGRVLDEVHRDLGLDGAAHASAAGLKPQAVAKIGDRVHVASLDREGEVADDYGDDVLVAIGPMKIVVPKKGLPVTRRAPVRLAERGDRQQAPSDGRSRPGNDGRPRQGGATATLEAATHARTELDVRGKRFVEAEPLVEKWIDESRLAGLTPLRLIHGKGTGLLGRGLQQWLKELAGVRDVRYGNPNEGGGGVTMFELS